METIKAIGYTVEISELSFVEMSDDRLWYEIHLKDGSARRIRSTVTMVFEDKRVMFA